MNYCGSDYESGSDYCNYNYDSTVESDHDSGYFVDIHCVNDLKSDYNASHVLDHCDCYYDYNLYAHEINQNSH